MFSMMSISPHLGHGFVSMSSPRSQKAGQIPLPVGSLIRALEAPVGLREVAVGVEAGGGVVAGDAVGAGEILFVAP